MNKHICVMGLACYLMAGDIFGVFLQELYRGAKGHFSLLYDVRKAHRVIPMRESDRGLHACKIDNQTNAKGNPVLWLNMV